MKIPPFLHKTTISHFLYPWKFCCSYHTRVRKCLQSLTMNDIRFRSFQMHLSKVISEFLGWLLVLFVPLSFQQCPLKFWKLTTVREYKKAKQGKIEKPGQSPSEHSFQWYTLSIKPVWQPYCGYSSFRILLHLFKKPKVNSNEKHKKPQKYSLINSPTSQHCFVHKCDTDYRTAPKPVNSQYITN